MYEDCQVIADQYVNVFGDPIEVAIDNNDEVYVSLNDVKMTGFSIFKRTEYDMLRNMDRKIIVAKEFDLFMLSQASEYLLDRMITFINNEDIVETISRCRSKLGLELPSPKIFQQRPRHSIGNPYNNNISIRVENQEPHQRNINFRTDSFNSRPSVDGFNNRPPTDGFNNRPSTDGFNNRPSTDGFNSNRKPGSFNNRQSTDGFNSHRRNDGFNSLQSSDGFNNQRSGGHDSRQQNRGGGGNRDAASRSKSRNRSTNSRTSFTDDTAAQMRPPKNLPSNFTPTHTQRTATQENFKSRRTNEPSEFWDNDKKPENKQQEQKRFKNFDTQSQTSSTSSGKKPNFLKRMETVETIEKVNLEIGETYTVRVTDLEKENICWVQEIESSKNIDELLLELDDIAAEAETISNVTQGQLALADYEGAWCRCRVMITDPLNVLFIDYGNRANVTEVKTLPPKFKKTPALACRLSFKSAGSIQLENEMELKVKVKQKYDDDTCVVDIVQQSRVEDEKKETPKTESPPAAREPAKQQQEVVKEPAKQQEPVEETSVKEKHYFTIPEPLTEIQNGDKVLLSDLVGNKFAVKTKECASKSKEILEYIKSLNKCELMLTSVKESQLVLCSKDGMPNLCRGVVKKKVSPTIVTVKYLDYSGEDQLSVKSLRNIDDRLAREPCTLLYTPELPVISSLTDKSLNYLEGLFEKKEKAVVVINEDRDFDLQMDDKSLLSEKLLLLEKPPKKEESKPDSGPVTSTPNKPKTEEIEKPKNQTEEKKIATPKKEDTPASKNEEPVTYDDMPFIEAKVGTTGGYVCYNITDVTELTLISMNEEVLTQFETVSVLEPEDDVPFEPENMNMCLVLYKSPEEEDATWYRAVVLDKEAAGYAVSMVDFGTQATIKSKDIRKFPRNLKDIPIMGILCSLKDVPNDEKCNARIKELLPEGQEVKAKVLEFLVDEIKYVIDIPEITETLKKEGLCK
ncbi:unnamed protein product [Psylliodes chrysocephalus]|nr:unnamed protein product [Psylliodes chrysocephala]